MSAWEPGDVALVTRDDGSTSRAIWTRFGYGWQCVEGGPPIVDARRLVVIDPEDAEQVRVALAAWFGVDPARVKPGEVERAQAAYRSLANPTPRIEEPTGLGAVVEDVEGLRYVRHNFGAGGAAWCCDEISIHWEDVDAVRILSEGVPS